MIKRLLATLAIGALIALGGCSVISGIGTAANTTVTASQISSARDTAYGLESSYDLALSVAIAWARQPTCGTPKAPPAPLCKTLAGMEKAEGLRVRFRSAIDRLNSVIKDTTTTTSVLSATINVAQSALKEYQSALPTAGGK